MSMTRHFWGLYIHLPGALRLRAHWGHWFHMRGTMEASGVPALRAQWGLDVHNLRGRDGGFQVSFVVDGMMVRNPAFSLPTRRRDLLQMGALLDSPANDGFTFDCSANTPWRPVGCGPLMAPISHFPTWNRRGL
jgi:hypothetical protein